MTVTGAVRAALLLGPDHPALGEVAVDGLAVEGDAGPATLGAALSAGWLPKAVPALEPNEDGALLAVGPAGVLLAVADGHNGAAASVGALRALLGAAPGLLGSCPAAGVELAAAFATVAHGAVARPAARAGGSRAPASGAGLDQELPARTALSLVVATADTFAAVGYGDTVAAVLRHGRLRLLGEPTDFLGPESAPDPFAGHRIVRRHRRAGDALVVVSDGVTDYLGRAFAAVAAAAVATSDPDAGRAAARSLVSRAGAAGAGDNLAAVVLLAPAARRWLPRF